MTKAFILVNTPDGEEKRVLDLLKKKKYVSETYPTDKGVYDVIAKIELDNMDLLKNEIKNIKREGSRYIDKIETLVVSEST